ncbi:multidrug resistance-associated protein 1-like, partial [Thraustotheca clavata]
TESGENLFSRGQAQLLCICRAFLRKSKVVCIDEATASIDHATDHLLQQTLQSVFQHTTVLTVAHRMNNIMKSERIIVLDNGKVVENDSPSSLLENPNGTNIPAGMLTNVPSAVVHANIFVYLDASSLARMGMTSREWQEQVCVAVAWRQHVQQHFNIVVGVFPLQELSMWRLLYASLVFDSKAIENALSVDQVLEVYKSVPLVKLSSEALPIRSEAVLMHGLRKFPTSIDLIQFYAAALRNDMF